jgi:hypothetical protein
MEMVIYTEFELFEILNKKKDMVQETSILHNAPISFAFGNIYQE